MQQDVNPRTMMAVIAAAVVILGGLGLFWVFGRGAPRPPADYQPVSPPGGSSGQASGMAGRMRQAGQAAPGMPAGTVANPPSAAMGGTGSAGGSAAPGAPR
jgi:hypothetical protein